MIAVKVMKQENKYILKMIDKLYELAREAHYMKVLRTNQVENCLEFFQEYVVQYQQVKQEKIFFKHVERYVGKEISPFIDRVELLHARANKYLDEMSEACRLYHQGKYLAIYEFINSAMSYQAIAKVCIVEEEKLYSYSTHILPDRYQQMINTQIAKFHKEIDV